MATHITCNKEFENIPQGLQSSLHKYGVNIEKSYTRYRLYDKLMLFPHVVHHDDHGDVYLMYIPNAYAKKSWGFNPIANPRAMEYVARENSLNVIFIYEKDIDLLGEDVVAQCISEKIHSRMSDRSKVHVIKDDKNNTIDIFYNGALVGKVHYIASRTAISITEWFSIPSPRMWIEDVCSALSQDNIKKILKFSFHPHGITKCDDLMYFSKKMSHKRMNIMFDDNKSILRSAGWTMNITLPYHNEKELFADHLPQRDMPPLYYPVYEEKQKKVEEKKKIKYHQQLLKKVSKNNPPDVLDLPYSSHKYILFTCDKGHEYHAVVKEQTKFGCPVCSGDTVIPGVNDLKTTDPHIAANWDYEGSFPYTPEDFSRKSDREMSWVCPTTGATWRSTIGRYVKYGVSPYVSNKTLLPGYNDIATRFPEIVPLFSTENTTTLDTILSTSYPETFIWSCPDCGRSWRRKLKTMIDHPYCLVCNRSYRSTSIGERELSSYVRSVIGNTTDMFENDRSAIYPLELDMYIPDKQVAIEFNGLYWHSDAHLGDKWYHYNKWKTCQERGIQLITVWEDDWRDRRSVVESMLAHKLGVSQGEKVFARKTHVELVDKKSAEVFLDTYHIQGYSSGSVYYGLKDIQGNLVAVSSWRKQGDVLYLDRYATSCHVVGGMGKLFKEALNYAQLNNVRSIVTFSDNQHSDGELYKKLGFTADRELSPDYKYLVNGKRKHKFGYRKIKFKNDPALKYHPDMTERQLAKLNGLHRIYDSGKTRWVLTV